MRTWKLLLLAASFGLAVFLTACQTPRQTGTSAKAVPAELVQTNYLYEVTRHLYRWYLDEAEVERVVQARQFVFWVRRLDAKLDPGDQSQFGEIVLPQLGLSVKVKKADYFIEEFQTAVKSRTFKITQVERVEVPAAVPANYTVVAVDMKAMLDYLFRTRSQRDYPDAALLERMRQALRKELIQQGAATNAPAEQVAYLSPLSPVANEVWVFWETGRKLLHFASDIDLANPAVWQHETMMVRVFDLDQQVVLTHDEAPGSNRFLTRHQVGRALFNCVVLGQRVVVTSRPLPGAGADGTAVPLAPAPAPPDR
jgi:hypothetical protein